jgi:hypothetical protein
MVKGMSNLNALDPGDPHAAEELLPLVYDERRRDMDRALQAVAADR